MPKLNKGQQLTVKEIVTKNGEITINLNLRIDVGADGLIFSAGTTDNTRARSCDREMAESGPDVFGEKHMEVPEDMFDDVPTLQNFGKPGQ